MKKLILLGYSYLLSKLYQVRFRVKFRLQGGLELSNGNVVNQLFGKDYYNAVPWSGVTDSTFYTDYLKKGHTYGEYGGDIKVNWDTDRDNPCIWLLQMSLGKVQEIDVFESNKVNGKRGLYFSIYNNEESDQYYSDPVNGTGIIYDRFQTRLRDDKLMDYLAKNKVEYKIKWEQDKVTWYVAGEKVAVSYVYVPYQVLYILLTNYKG